jgi:hypothetical protein
MSDTPRTDAVLAKLENAQVSYADACYQLIDLARDLERAVTRSGSGASREASGRHSGCHSGLPIATKKVSRRAKSS